MLSALPGRTTELPRLLLLSVSVKMCRFISESMCACVIVRVSVWGGPGSSLPVPSWTRTDPVPGDVPAASPGRASPQPRGGGLIIPASRRDVSQRSHTPHNAAAVRCCCSLFLCFLHRVSKTGLHLFSSSFFSPRDWEISFLGAPVVMIISL